MIPLLTALMAAARRPSACLLLALIPVLSGGHHPCAAQETAPSVTLAWFPDFSPDGKWLVAPYGRWGQDDQGEVRVWNVATGEPRFVIESLRGVRAVAWSPKGTFFASGNYGGYLRLYDADTGQPTWQATTGGESIELVQITPDERRLVTAGGSGNIRVWTIPDKTPTRVLKGHTGGIWGMRLAPDGKTLASAGKDATVRIWNIDSGEQVHLLPHPGETNGVAFTNDSRTLLTGCRDGEIRVFEVADGQWQRSLLGHEGSVTDLHVSPDGKLLASSGVDRTVRIWNLEDGRVLATLNGHEERAFGVRFSPMGDVLASTGWDTTVRLWDVKSGQLVRVLKR